MQRRFFYLLIGWTSSCMPVVIASGLSILKSAVENVSIEPSKQYRGYSGKASRAAIRQWDNNALKERTFWGRMFGARLHSIRFSCLPAIFEADGVKGSTSTV